MNRWYKCKSHSTLTGYVIWLVEGVIVHVYGKASEGHLAFKKGELHNVWSDHHIDHKPSMTIQLINMYWNGVLTSD